MLVALMAMVGRAVPMLVSGCVRAHHGEQLGAEEAGDERAQERQEDNDLVHAPLQPFMRWMSSTAIEPRLRK